MGAVFTIITLMFYNCENLLFSEGHTYEKLINLSRVIVAAGEGRPLAIVGLAEVENDSILKRWTQHTPLARWHYRYLVTNSPDRRGINVGLLYQPDSFRLLGHESVSVDMPADIRPTRDLLHAWGRIISGDTLDVVVCHLPSRYGGKKASDKARAIAHVRLRTLMDSIVAVRKTPRLVVMGDMNDYPTSKSMCRDFVGYQNLMLPLQKALRKGHLKYGSHKHEGEWGFLDQFLVNSSIFSNPRPLSLPFMLTTDNKYLGKRPKRSRYGAKYEAGYSDHLPILLDVLVP